MEWYLKQEGLHKCTAQPMTSSRASWHKDRSKSSEGMASRTSCAAAISSGQAVGESAAALKLYLRIDRLQLAVSAAPID